MRVLLTGASGQLGQALLASAPLQLAQRPLELLPLHRSDLDLRDLAACRAAVKSFRPHWLINAAAYTAVDRAEQEPDVAMAVNAAAPAAFAEALVQEPEAGRLLQISTDFVFSGEQGTPYQPDQLPAPLGAYGASKAEGERRVLACLGSMGRAHVLRTGWLYGPVGHNFCRTMLRLHRQRAETGEPLPVVADQVGCPTSTAGLAAACWRLLSLRAEPLPSVLHWSDAGAASWFDFALAIGELAEAQGLLKRAAAVIPITTAAYPTPARRPSYSLLDCTATRVLLGLDPQPWRTALTAVLRAIKS